MLRLLKAFYILFLLGGFLSPPAHAFGENLQLKYFCATHSKYCKNASDSQSLPEPLKTALFACETITKSTFCQDLVKKKPEFYDHLKRCKPDQFCEDHLSQELTSIPSCAQGFLEGTGENFSNLSALFKHAEQNIQIQNKMLRECNLDIQCKKSLVKRIPKFKDMPDVELDKFTAAALMIERNNYSYIHSTNERQGFRGKTLSERAEAIEAYEKTNPRSSTSDDALLITIKSWLQKKNAHLECLDSKTQAEMICWGAAYILDPLLVAGTAAKGSRLAKYIIEIASDKSTQGIMSTASRASLEASESSAQKATRKRVEQIEDKIRSSMIAPGVNAETLKANVHSVWSNTSFSAEDKVKKTFEEYLRLRMENLSPEKRKLAEEALADIKKPKRTEMAQFDPRDNRITIGDPISDDLMNYYNVLTHEFEHLTQTGRVHTPNIVQQKISESMDVAMNKLTLKSDLKGLQYEYEAIGAQWDFLQSIPPEIKKQSIINIKRNPNLSTAFKNTVIRDIQYSNLSREDYIKVLPQEHNYGLNSTPLMDDRALRTAFIGAATIGTAGLVYGVVTAIPEK